MPITRTTPMRCNHENHRHEGRGEARAGWNTVRLNRLATRAKQKNRDESIDRVLTNSAEFGVVDQRDFFDKDIATQGKLEGYVVVELGSYVYNPRISSTAPVGPLSKNKIGTGVMSPLYTAFKFKDDRNDFYEYFFKTTGWHNYMRQASSTGARHDRMAISSDGFMAMPLPMPSPDEQQKIAECLSSIDLLIAAQARKVDALKTHKKGLMQQLFPGEGETQPRLRFPEFQKAGEWEWIELGEKVDLLSGYPFDGPDISQDSSGIPLLRGINVTEGRIRHSPEIDRYYTETTEGLEKFRLQTNDLVIGMDGSKVGKNSALVSEVDAGALLIQRVARLRANKASLIQFNVQRIHSPSFHAYVDRINTSSGIPHISAKQIKEFRICFPPLPEQQRIATCLSSLDALITAETQKLEALKAHKKGLMQQLFPSPKEVEV
jgi:type I restriction enzyme, S subunit